MILFTSGELVFTDWQSIGAKKAICPDRPVEFHTI